MGVEIGEQTRDSLLDKAVEIHLVDIFVADEVENGLKFLLGGCRTVVAVHHVAGKKT